MLPKKNLLNLTYSFQKLRTTGRRQRIGPITIFTRTENNQPTFQASVIVPTNVTKLKPTRNRIRRLIYHNLRTNTARFPHSLQLVIMVYEDLSLWDKTPLANLLNQTIEQIFRHPSKTS